MSSYTTTRTRLRGKGSLGTNSYRATKGTWAPKLTKKHVGDSEDKKFVLKLELKFARRVKDKKPVLTKWSAGQRATWGEKGKSRFSYEKGDVFLSTTSKWRELYQLYEKDGLPLDPDPITTVDIAFGVIDPPVEKDYKHGYRILDINLKHKFVTVAPVVLVEHDAVVLPNEGKGKTTKYKYLQLNSATKTWTKSQLDSELIKTDLIRTFNDLGKAIEFTMQATVVVLDMATGGARAAAAAAAKKYFKKKFKSLGALLKVLAKLDAPVGKALLSMAKTLSKELAKNQLIKSHFQANANASMAGATILPSYKKNDPSFKPAIMNSATAFATTFVSEVLGEIFTKKITNDEFLRRRIKYSLGGDVTEDFLTAPFRKAVKEFMYKFCFTDRVNDVINIINDALVKSNNVAEFEQNLWAEFKTKLGKALESGLRSSVELLAK